MFLNLAGATKCSRCEKQATGWHQPIHSIAAAAPLNPGPYPYCADHMAEINGYALRSDLDLAMKRIAVLEADVESWKKRAAQHGCNVADGDDDCG